MCEISNLVTVNVIVKVNGTIRCLNLWWAFIFVGHGVFWEMDMTEQGFLSFCEGVCMLMSQSKIHNDYSDLDLL